MRPCRSIDWLSCHWKPVDMFSLVLIGNSTTRFEHADMVTPRGYPGAELS